MGLLTDVGSAVAFNGTLAAPPSLSFIPLYENIFLYYFVHTFVNWVLFKYSLLRFIENYPAAGHHTSESCLTQPTFPPMSFNPKPGLCFP